MYRNGAQGIPLGPKQHTEFGLAEPGRILQHCLEHRREIAGRAADDLEHLRGDQGSRVTADANLAPSGYPYSQRRGSQGRQYS
jgi:hypothetical protein